MRNLFVTLYLYFRKQKWAFYSLLILSCSILAWGVSRINLVQDLNQSITGNKTVSSFFQLLDKKSVNKDITFIIENKNQVPFDSLQRIGEDFSKEALKKFPGFFDKLSQESEDPNEVYSYLLQHIPSYLDTSSIPKEIDDFQYVEQKIKENHAKLFTPEGIFLKPYLFKDPFGFVPSILLSFQKNYTSSALDAMDGSYILAKDSSLVIRGQFSNSFLTKKDKLKALKKIETWSTNYFKQQKISWDYFSTDRIALANAEQVKNDTILTLVVSLTAILLLLFLYYRKITLPFFFLVPGAFGILFSLGLIGFFHPNITGLAIGIGAIVAGIIVDYSFHFFTHLKHTNSISETIIAISKPLIIACLTTILAFGALFFTHSVILSDFGLFASLSLVGTLFGVFVILPVILPKSWEKETEKGKEIIEEIVEEKAPRFKNQRKWFLISTILISIFCIYELPNVEFEKDLEKLNFYPKEIKDAEQKITGFIPADEKRIFVAVANKNEKKAQTANIQLNKLLKQLRQEGKIDNFLNSAELVLTKSQEEKRLNEWKSYWKNRKDKLFAHLDALELELGYTPTAFDNFKATINEQIIQNDYDISLINEIRSKLEDHSGNNFSYLSILSVPRDHLDEVKQILRKNNEFTVLDRADLANSIVKSVNDDFNYILYASTLIVFIVLLITFGRMELTLITFIPMILSWIWILGFAAFFDIKFNLVNVVITTFIFGLGDDFAIFITEGYLIKYRTGKNYLRSFKIGTILSAATTILGTGVLLLAKHPAIHSIGLISIIGLSSILFMSLFVQPILIEWLITNRTEKKKAPWTLTGLLISGFAFTFFLTGCLIVSIVQLSLRIIPFGRKRHKKILHYVFRDFCWAQIYIMLNVRKKFLGRENLNFNRPSIIIANHQSFIDILAMIMLDPRIILMTNNWVYKSFFFGRAVRFLDYLPNEKGVESMVDVVQSKIDKGYSVMIFPEGSRSKTD
ncbi:MAG: 1-acyl-sn-glycerol-3-phosphate acyltransferase, partial [Crocinitomicaceae bacterium]